MSYLKPIIISMCFLFLSLHAIEPTENQQSWSGKAREKLSQVKFLNEIMVFEAVIPLEQNDQVFFDFPTLAMMFGCGYFVSDDSGSTLYRYHADGAFDRVVTRRGHGPGEISYLMFGARIFDNQLAFYDIYKKEIKVFTAAGLFAWKTNLEKHYKGESPIIMTGEAFAWPEPDQLIFSNTFIRDQPEAQAVRFHVLWENNQKIKQLTIERVLSHRNTTHEKKFGTPCLYDLRRVGDKYWLGSQEFSQITMLNPDTPRITKPTNVRLPDALTPALYEGVSIRDSKTLSRLINMNGTIHDILPLGKIVLVKVGALGYVPFDQTGQQLLERRLLLKWANLRDAHNGLILATTDHRKAKILAERAGVPLPEPIGNVAVEDDSPYLVLMRLKPEFR